MCRASEVLSQLLRRRAAAVPAVALLLALATPTARADDLLAYLESRGLDALAARRVEALASTASADERSQLLDRLAEIYARMLDAASDPENRARVLTRADELAAGLVSAKGDRLRVAAARARYQDAARIAEAIRAGIVADGAAAAAVLDGQVDALLEVGKRSEKRVSDLERRADRTDGLGRDLLRDEINVERGIAGQARFLAAWSLLYRGFLAKDAEETSKSAELFADLLGARDGRLAPADVSEDLRSDETYASAILGLSLAKARSAGYSEATRWLALLDSNATHPSVRDLAPGWTMVAALEGRAFVEARAQFGKLAPRADAALWARVAVARSIEDGGGSKDAAALVREGLATLAARRDLAAVRDLVGRYGEGILGEDSAGFVGRYVRAVRLYDEAQSVLSKAGTDADRLASEEVRGPSRAAAAALAAALEATDAAQFAEATLSCRQMQAWSLRGAGEFAEAAKRFDEVAAAGTDARAEDAARAAIACTDDARRVATDATQRAALDKELVARVDAFLQRFPGSDHVPELLVRKVAASAEPSIVDVEQLLRVPRDSKEWLPSRRQALGALYRAFRGGKDPRAEVGRRYALLLDELPREEGTGLPAGSTSIARQALEVLLAPEVRDLDDAARLLAALEAAAALGTFDAREADEELAYRRLQLAILADRWADAEAALAPFEKPEATGIWADAGLRLALRGAESKRRSLPSDAPDRGGFVATICRAGDAILARAGGAGKALAPDAPDAAALAQVARVLLDARVELVASAGSAEEGKRGLALADALLVGSPRDMTLLQAAAVFAEASGDLERAATSLRTLVGGLPPRTNPWFEAKIGQIRVLGKLDPARARVVLDQYRTLYPDLGPEPWRERFAELDRTLPPAPAPAPTPDPARATEPRQGEGRP